MPNRRTARAKLSLRVPTGRGSVPAACSQTAKVDAPRRGQYTIIPTGVNLARYDLAARSQPRGRLHGAPDTVGSLQWPLVTL